MFQTVLRSSRVNYSVPVCEEWRYLLKVGNKTKRIFNNSEKGETTSE